MYIKHKIGRQKENEALIFLKKYDCQLIEKNWSCKYGEIDLIMKNDGIILFIEVKYRRNNCFGGAISSIDTNKIEKIQKAAEFYLQKKRLNDVACRIDAVLFEDNQPPIWLKNITG